MLTMMVVPVAVAAEVDWEAKQPATDSKIPFGILGSFFYLLGDALLPELMTGLDMKEDFGWAENMMAPIGDWISEPLAWLTNLTAWSMVLVGDVLSVAAPIIEEVAGEAMPIAIGDLADVFYVVAARMYDLWGVIADAVTGAYPAANVTG